MSVKQINASYLVNEDRILFRFNTQNQEEYRFWFTRRVTLFILAATSHLIAKIREQAHSSDAANALNNYEKEAILEASKNEQATSQAYETGLNFPLGFDPILVMDVTCSLTKNGENLTDPQELKEGKIDDILSLDLVLPGGANVNLKLATNTLQMMCVLLDQLRLQAGWGEAVLQVKNSPNQEQYYDSKLSEKISIH